MTGLKETEIHSLIRIHPYLVDESLVGMERRHERVYEDGTRSDFVFSRGDDAVVIEVKRGALDTVALGQCVHYLKKEKRKRPGGRLRGFLVGQKPPDDRELIAAIEATGFGIQCRYLGLEFPTTIKLCLKCRRANRPSSHACRYCGSTKFVIDDFLFAG